MLPHYETVRIRFPLESSLWSLVQNSLWLLAKKSGTLWSCDVSADIKGLRIASMGHFQIKTEQNRTQRDAMRRVASRGKLKKKN